MNFINRQKERLRHPQVVGLLAALLMVVLVLYFLGAALAPVITALFIAYLLDSLVTPLVQIHMPRTLATFLVFSLFILAMALLTLGLVPIIGQQVTELIQEMPRITQVLKEQIRSLIETYSGVINPALVEDLLVDLMNKAKEASTQSLGLVGHVSQGLITTGVYLFLVPFLVFFFLLDKADLRKSYCTFLPDEQNLLEQVVREANAGLGGYIRGKFWEMMLIGSLAFFVFTLMEFRYALIMGVLTGMSVLIPFVGVAVVALPVAVLGMTQWGFGMDGMKPLFAYAIIQIVDANLVAPLILGESAKIHPTTFIIAVLVFGSLWGLLGVFFAVPLAVLARSIYQAIASIEVNGTRGDEAPKQA
ncbi:AI-2E family transporter [Magnetococcus sp. PR-3]|uniref:AI-2E family transporter n=1 Tax=Magnetococcus sp. PR-3 TaxID=3120355 RepID=UPI002FCE3A30